MAEWSTARGLLVVVLAAAPLAPAPAQSLIELYRAAEVADPAVAGARAQQRAAQERDVQAGAAFAPSASVSVTRNQSNYIEPTSFFTPDARVFGNKQAVLQITQPVFKLALGAQKDQTEAQAEQALLQAEQARIDGLQRFVESTFEMFKARDTLQHLLAQQESTAAQLALARRSFTVGTVAITDVRDAQAKADVVATQVIAARHDLGLRHQIVMELVGRPVPALLARGLVDDPLPALDRAGLQQWLSDGLASSPALRQAQWGLEAARHEVRKAGVAHAPTVDLNLSHTQLSESASVTTTTARRSTQDQVGLTINVPLFAGGATQSRVREALALQEKAQADVDSARRTLTLNLRQHFTSTLASSSQAQGLAVAVKSQETALRANRRGYEVGMKVGAEVLDAQTKLFEARRDLSRARYDAWLSFIKLKCAAGVVAETDLARIDALLQPLNPPLVLDAEILDPAAAPAMPRVPAAPPEPEPLPAESP